MSSNFSYFPNSVSAGIQQVNTDYDPHIIKPPDRNLTHGSVAKHLHVDSRNRNLSQYPSSSKYRIEIDQDFKDVTSVELTLAQIPNTFYNVEERNNNFLISENRVKINSIKIPEGQYTNDLLLETFNGKYGDLFYELQSKYNFSRDPVSQRLRIQSNRATGEDFIYNLNYTVDQSCAPCQLNSIDRTIGFLNKEYYSSVYELSYTYIEPGGITNTGTVSDQEYTVYKLVANPNYNGTVVDFTSSFRVNDYFILSDGTNTFSCQVYEIKNDVTILFEELDNNDPTAISGFIFQNISVLYSPNIFQVQIKPYVILKIKDFNNVNALTSSANNSYTIIPLTGSDVTLVNSMTIPVHGVIKYFNPPLGKLYWMDIEFLNPDGSLFEFRGQENMMLFTISMLNQPGKYNNYVNSN